MLVQRSLSDYATQVANLLICELDAASFCYFPILVLVGAIFCS